LLLESQVRDDVLACVGSSDAYPDARAPEPPVPPKNILPLPPPFAAADAPALPPCEHIQKYKVGIPIPVVIVMEEFAESVVT